MEISEQSAAGTSRCWEAGNVVWFGAAEISALDSRHTSEEIKRRGKLYPLREELINGNPGDDKRPKENPGRSLSEVGWWAQLGSST